jgi:hypothetical protein
MGHLKAKEIKMTKDEIQDQINEINLQLDPLEQWRQGYQQGIKSAVESINEMTGNEFKDIVEVILYMRKLS